MQTSPLHPARIEPPERQLPPIRLLRTVIDNPLRAWTRAMYREPFVCSRVLGRDTVYVMAPDLIRQLLVDETDRFDKGEITRRALGPALGEAILTADGARWRWQRRAVASMFRPERIRGYLPDIIGAAERTRDRLCSLAAGAEIDIAREMTRTTFDIVMGTILHGGGGIDVDLMERSIDQYLDSTSWIVALAMIGAPRWVPYPGVRKTRRAREHLHAVLDALIKEGAERRGEAEDLLSLLRKAKDPETSRSMSELDLRHNLITFITAGHETTAVALSWTFYLLAIYPEAEQQLRDEIEAVTAGAPLRAEHVEALTYARQVVQESMRLYPPAALIARDARRDLRLGEVEVRAGTTVYVPVYAVHRHEAYWQDPDEFDPSRFEPAAIDARDRYTYLPFGAGPRTCIGQGFAQLEATAVLATIMHECQLRLRPGFVPQPRLRVTLRPAPGMPMQVTHANGGQRMRHQVRVTRGLPQA